ncbi:phage regulator Rha-like protein [Variovorax boronicumulans]|uniref:Rha family transcriptional regulator n=1 Tax=Variovorax boronicumulans TaxID=436515 RepID=UPI0027814D47|nr:Rha family transcriptional regulator [Variovorax boronicumulans]MDP9908246.1 phage regulator Rha-like protein [Variovorax boronicumulans]
MTSVLVQVHLDGEPTADSRDLAVALGNTHRPLFALVLKYLPKFQEFGEVIFQKAVGSRPQGGGNPERYALLNEDQSYLLLTMARNSKRAVDLKTRLVHEFAKARAGVRRMGRSFTERRLALERRDRASKDQASTGARLMCARRRELPAIRAEREALEGQMQRKLFGTNGDIA